VELENKCRHFLKKDPPTEPVEKGPGVNGKEKQGKGSGLVSSSSRANGCENYKSFVMKAIESTDYCTLETRNYLWGY
jgi:hypothetical protein